MESIATFVTGCSRLKMTVSLERADSYGWKFPFTLNQNNLVV
jgi:hypothetical protein